MLDTRKERRCATEAIRRPWNEKNTGKERKETRQRPTRTSYPTPVPRRPSPELPRHRGELRHLPRWAPVARALGPRLRTPIRRIWQSASWPSRFDPVHMFNTYTTQ
ncbi:hypothetical protein B0H17DRAFT_341937 [Mycena rosella]|uniref:Uncharacterized protein n=1 Tax=Mycena rosella TaxID=1033263 RepID=A0AAD7GJM9_MYCRO|nr:hypothetical protein B0H17DRAFT_341937 [Mycena rosella]